MARTGGRRVSEIRDELGTMMNEKVAVFRTQEGLTEAHEIVRRLKEEAKTATIDDRGTVFNQDVLGAIELGYMLDCAECIVVGALERKESRGAQFRLDFPKRNDDEWLKHIDLSMNGGGRAEGQLLAGDDHQVGAAGADLLGSGAEPCPSTRCASAATRPSPARPPTGRTSTIDLDGHRSVLDGILQAKDREDGSIGIRCSCRAAICGSCGVRINGKPDLACHTHLDKAFENARRRRHHRRADGQHAGDQGPDRRHGRGPLEEDPARHAVAAAGGRRRRSASTSCRPSR